LIDERDKRIIYGHLPMGKSRLIYLLFRYPGVLLKFLKGKVTLPKAFQQAKLIKTREGKPSASYIKKLESLKNEEFSVERVNQKINVLIEGLSNGYLLEQLRETRPGFKVSYCYVKKPLVSNVPLFRIVGVTREGKNESYLVNLTSFKLIKEPWCNHYPNIERDSLIWVTRLFIFTPLFALFSSVILSALRGVTQKAPNNTFLILLAVVLFVFGLIFSLLLSFLLTKPLLNKYFKLMHAQIKKL